MDVFRVRLNNVDHYQSFPTDLDPQLFGEYGSTQRVNAPHVPVIRVFGATETGQKVCAHIHGAMPYLYIEYRGSLEKDSLHAYIHQLRASIDHALAVSYRRNVYDGKAVYVAHITLVKGIPFFGYHVGYRFFLKVYLLNPLHMTRFADLLHQGAIMKQAFQPFESHLQYLLQWMCDFNLYGCAYVDCNVVRFRSPVPEYAGMDNLKHVWHDKSIKPECISNSAMYPRQSHCPLEVDIRVQDILNRTDVEVRDLHADFVERFNPVAPEEKLVHSLAGLWKDETRRRKLRMGLTDPSSSPFPAEVLISMSADPRHVERGGWIHEEEFRRLVDELVHEEKQNSSEADVNFDEFVHPNPFEATIQTVLQSVEDLFPDNIKAFSASWSQNLRGQDGKNDATPAEVVVDETSTPRFIGEDFPYESDEDVAREIAFTQRKALDGDSEQGLSSNSKDDVSAENQEVEALSESFEGDINVPKVNNDDSVNGYHFSHEHDSIALPQNFPERSLDTGEVDKSVEREHEKRKRRKLNIYDTTGEFPHDIRQPLSEREDVDVHCSRSKIVAFESGAGDRSKKSPQRSQSPHSEGGQGTSASSQLTQTSIKAQGSAGSHGSFPVVKNPYPPSRTDGFKKPNACYDVHGAPQTPIRLNATVVPSKTPWSNLKSSLIPPPPISLSPATPLQLLGMAQNLNHGFLSNRSSYCFGEFPPTIDEVLMTLADSGLPPVLYQDAFYSDELDVPERSRDYASRQFKLESLTTPYLPLFDPTATSAAAFGAKAAVVVDSAKQEVSFKRKRSSCKLRHWDIGEAPPSRASVEQWLRKDSLNQKPTSKVLAQGRVEARSDEVGKKGVLSQVEGPTQRNKHGFKFTQKQKSTSVRHETQYMSTMSLEVHVNTRDGLVPNPELDAIACIFWCLKSYDDKILINGSLQETRVGVLALSEKSELGRRLDKETAADVEQESSELDLINRMVDIVRELDPDILTGYEVHNGSWGYLIERARIKYEYDLCDEFSRMKSQSHGRFGKDSDRWGFNHTSTIRVTGRHMINIWRAMRSELNLLQYTMENVAFHLLHKRIPHYPFRDLTRWYTSAAPRDQAKVIDYFLSRVQIDIEILDANELIPRTSEQARLIGVDFFSVFSRGSQFKVESFMFRIAKPENFLLVSPSRKQVGQQNALECLPLVMEPQSAFYNSPLLVLDFQSLYPSIMIAYNYCYSTCLGRIVGWRGQNKMGFADFKRQPRLLELVKDFINISPNGIMYVKPELRKSLLAKMLGEILETRVMVKSGMKIDKQDKTLQQLLNNRQLALKLLANVTYGYTSASFSGRMPCSEIADSIVQSGRETLEKAIALIHSVERWGAEVVYGDTDSIFVYLKGRTKDQAFRIGNEIAKTITDLNPRPIKLKFEKVYFPCVLLAKKRYVGFKYESPLQTEPEFDAKGIETVRRDGTPAEQKIEEKALKLLFRTADLSQVKGYFQRQCAKLMLGQVSIQDFCFAREVKLGTYADKGPPPPGALISTRRMLEDPRTEPQYGERVPYVVVTGAPGARLIDRCVSPEQLLNEGGSVELDAEYYISKNLIPPLERIFNLVGANVRQWYDEMPKFQRVRDLIDAIPPAVNGGTLSYAPNGALIPLKKTLENYMKSSNCIVCRVKLPSPALDINKNAASNTILLPLCQACSNNAASSLFTLRTRLHVAQRKAAQLESVCRSCSGLSWAEEVRCDSKDCPVFYTRVKARARERRVRGLVEGLGRVLEEAMEW